MFPSTNLHPSAQTSAPTPAQSRTTLNSPTSVSSTGWGDDDPKAGPGGWTVEPAAGPEPDVGTEPHAEFESMGLSEPVLRGIFGYGLERPSAVQQRAIVPAAAGRDVLMQAQAGTGKTAAFTIGLLERLDTAARETQALILSPTRDLALQTQRVVMALGDYTGATCHASIGGRSGRADGDALRAGPHVVTGTPGRVLDNLQRGSLRGAGIKTLVLDEVDVMLSDGFADAVRDVLQVLPPDAQVVVCSATYTPEVHAICKKILRSPARIEVQREELSLAGISQFYIDVAAESYKLDTLLDLYETLSVSQSVIFVNSRRRAMALADDLAAQDHTVSVIHGEMLQDERDATLREFTSGSSRVLIATDIVARGIDVQQVSVVVNFDLPRDRENYIHRIGRCGRFGRKGVAINLVAGADGRDGATLRDIEQFWSTEIGEMPANVLDFL